MKKAGGSHAGDLGSFLQVLTAEGADLTSELSWSMDRTEGRIRKLECLCLPYPIPPRGHWLKPYQFPVFSILCFDVANSSWAPAAWDNPPKREEVWDVGSENTVGGGMHTNGKGIHGKVDETLCQALSWDAMEKGTSIVSPLSLRAYTWVGAK